jgi:hypothetical protein
MISVLGFLLACLAPFSVAAAAAGSPLLLGGEAQIGTEPPTPLHVELLQQGEQVSATFSTEDTSLVFSGTRSGQVVDFRKLTNATLVGEPVGATPNGWQEVRGTSCPIPVCPYPCLRRTIGSCQAKPWSVRTSRPFLASRIGRRLEMRLLIGS